MVGVPLVVHYWADVQSVYGFRCYDNIAPNAKCQRVLVLAHMPAGVASSYRPSRRNGFSTVDVINIAADRQKFMTLTGELS